MSKFLTKLLITTVAVLIVSFLLSGVHVNTVFTAFVLSLVLAFLNGIVKPILVLLTIPITVVTLGLFLLVINVIIVKLAAMIVTGFEVDNWLWALVFSILMSFITSLLEVLFGTKEKSNRT